MLADRIKQWEMQYQENAYVQADKVQIYTIAHRLNQKDMKSNTVAVFIQTKADASVISNGHFVSLADFSSKIEELSHEYDEVLLVKHPYEEILPELMTMLSSKISVVETNSYALLCNSNIKKVVTISSSIGCEAKFFEKETEFLLGEPLRKGGSLVARDTYSFALGQVLLQRDFWEHILVGKNQQSWKFAKHFEQPDLFRKLIHSWAYEDINPRNHNVSKRAYRKIGLSNLSLTEISGRIDLTSDNDRTKNSLLSGFSHAESDGRWTDGYKAEFFVYIGDSAKGVEIKINCAYLDDYAREQAIEVKVANKSVGTAIIHDQGVYVLRIPVVQKGGAVVELALPNASSPAKSGSADYRTLGLKINYIETTAKDVSELEALLYSSVKI